MAKLKTLIETNYNSKAYSVKELQQVRRQMAKAANQRMVRLETNFSPITGEAYTWGAHEHAQKYLKKKEEKKKRKGVEGKLRYNEKATALKTKRDLQEEINELQAFLSAKTSRVGEQKKIEKARIKTFESGKWGGTEEQPNGRKLKFASTKQFYDFLSSKLFGDLSAVLTSEQVVELYDAAVTKEQGEHEKVVKLMQAEYDRFQNSDIETGVLTLRQMEELFGVQIT